MAKALQKYLQSDRLQLKESLPNAEQVDLSEVLADLSLAEVAIGADLKLFSASISRLDEIDSTLSRMPAADVVEQPKQLWEASVRGLAKAELQLEQADQALEESRRLRTRAVERYSAVLERRVKSKHGHEKITLAISRSESIRGVLATFREKVAQRHATPVSYTHLDVYKRQAIDVQFKLRSGGVMHVYRVHRSWAAKADTLRERLEVYVDGVLDKALTEGWSETIEQWLPARLSAFCFFDGEQLEALAHPERSQAALRDAIHTLLGLDVVDQLALDLRTLERRQRCLLYTSRCV